MRRVPIFAMLVGCPDAPLISDCFLVDADDDGFVAVYAPSREPEDPVACPLDDPRYDAALANASDVAVDCDDAESARYPGAPELCNGADDDCDDAAEEDADHDGAPDHADGCPIDCAPDDPAVHPGAPEICNAVDDDCDGVADEGFDADLDGVGACQGDCDDLDPTIRPGADEGCDLVDSDCDLNLGRAEEDRDGDGSTPCDGDCDDDDPARRPGASEVCNGVDDDCNGSVPAGELDGDGDGERACSDCDDEDALRAPASVERCDQVDNDCDFEVDEGFDADADTFSSCEGDCDDGDVLVHPLAGERCNGVDDDCDGLVPQVEVDFDLDGFSECDGDCDDGRAWVNPAAPEVCDGLDDDCSGTPGPDELDLDHDGATTCGGDCDDGDRVANLLDLDGDGFSACAGDCDDLDSTLHPIDFDGDGASPCDGDCDDLDDERGPGVAEACNERDEDCDGLVDEDFPDANADHIADCVELCDGVDNDVDGATDEGFLSADGLGTHVSAATGTAGGDGTSLRPTSDLQRALDRSRTATPCSVLVQPGSYAGPFVVPARPFELRSTDGPEVTFLRPGGSGPILAFEPGAGRDTVVASLSLIDGALVDPEGDGAPTERSGAAVQIVGVDPTFRCARFERNVAVDAAGAVDVTDGSPLFEECLFADNMALGSAVGDGGGAVRIRGSGAPEIAGSAFLRNETGDDGGAVLVSSGAGVTITATRFAGNRAAGLGGGVALDEVSATLDGVLFQGDSAAVGGAVWVGAETTSPTLAHLTTVETLATAGFGGAVAFEGSGALLTDALLSFPTGGSLLGFSVDGAFVQPSPAVRYTLLWDSAGGNVFGNFGPPMTDVLGTDGNLMADPRFVAFTADGDLLDDDLRLSPLSPALDAGDPTTTDRDGTRSDLGGLGGPTPYPTTAACFGALP